jgi:hypothetical protein
MPRRKKQTTDPETIKDATIKSVTVKRRPGRPRKNPESVKKTTAKKKTAVKKTAETKTKAKDVNVNDNKEDNVIVDVNNDNSDTKKTKKSIKQTKRRGQKLRYTSAIASNKEVDEPTRSNSPNIIIHLQGVHVKDIENTTLDSTITSIMSVRNSIHIPTASGIDEHFAWIGGEKQNTSDSNFSNKVSNEPTENNIEQSTIQSHLHPPMKTMNNMDHTNDPLYHPQYLDQLRIEKEYNDIEVIHDDNWNGEDTTAINLASVVRDQDIRARELGSYTSTNEKKNILREFQYANKTSHWPQSVSVCCGWDFHPFTNMPIAIPTKFEDGKLHVTDVFCSLECAAAYIFCNEEGHFDDPDELYSLLHYVYKQSTPIRTALPRKALKIRGGTKTIDEFRQLSCDKKRTVNIVMPPFLSCIPIQEEVNTSIHVNSAGLNNMYIPVNKTKLDKASINIQEYRKRTVGKNNLGNYMSVSS